MERAKILILEDEIIVAKDMADMLGQWGYEVVGTVTTGEEAVEKSKFLKPGCNIVISWSRSVLIFLLLNC